MKNKIFYACSGAADLIRTHKYWLAGEHDPNEVSITFSSQIMDYCRQNDSDLYMISTHKNTKLEHHEKISIEHKAKLDLSFLGNALGFHIGEIIYAFRLLKIAIKFQSDLILADSGITHYFLLFLFRCFGIKVILILHNTLWPSGYPPRKTIPLLIQKLDTQFFKYGANAILGVSDECGIQVKSLTGNEIDNKIFQFRAQFEEDFFNKIPAVPEYTKQPFTIMFIGRIEKFKGVFDIVKIADILNQKHPNRFKWLICGTGPELSNLKEHVQSKKLFKIVILKGWIELEELVSVYAESHLAIVPTTDGFKEGLAMTAAESILAGRPIITNPVVPALNEMKPACYAAITNDIDSYISGIEKIACDKELYDKMLRACFNEKKQFLDRSKGLTAILKKSIEKIYS